MNNSSKLEKSAQECLLYENLDIVTRGVGYAVLALLEEARSWRKECVMAREKEEQRRDELLKKIDTIINCKP